MLWAEVLGLGLCLWSVSLMLRSGLRLASGFKMGVRIRPHFTRSTSASAFYPSLSQSRIDRDCTLTKTEMGDWVSEWAFFYVPPFVISEMCFLAVACIGIGNKRTTTHNNQEAIEVQCSGGRVQVHPRPSRVRIQNSLWIWRPQLRWDKFWSFVL